MVERRRFGNLFAHLVLGLGVAIVLLALLSTSRWAAATASRAAALFRELD